MAPDDSIPKAIKALYEPIEKIVKILAGPAAEEIGLTFRDSIRAWRFKRQVRLFNRVQEICAEAGIKPQAVKLPFLFDVVDKATLEEDDDLQDLWANLLANAADPEYQGLISTAFPDILRQLSKDEAAFLEGFYKKKRASAEELAEMKRTGEQFNIPYISEVCEDNLKRLRLIDWADRPEGVQLIYRLGETGGRKLRITVFGEAFIDACTKPSDEKKRASKRRLNRQRKISIS